MDFSKEHPRILVWALSKLVSNLEFTNVRSEKKKNIITINETIKCQEIGDSFEIIEKNSCISPKPSYEQT